MSSYRFVDVKVSKFWTKEVATNSHINDKVEILIEWLTIAFVYASK